ncbi:MAG: succinate--CoA ligase subunit alpha [Candidatus Hodarchaeales archaeon]
MMVLITRDTPIIIQGITGRQGSFHTETMLEYGTNIVAGVTPGKGGQIIHDIPVYNSVHAAAETHKIKASVVFVPAKFAKNAVIEGIQAGLGTIVVITEGVPVRDTMEMLAAAKEQAIIIGPNTAGMLVPPIQTKLGIMPNDLCSPGSISVITKSGTLSYEISKSLDLAGLGLANYLGIGGDPVRGSTFVDMLKIVRNDPTTKQVVLIGEIGGDEEEKAASFIKEHFDKPVFAYVAGKSAPEGKRMGHAGAIISGESGTAQTKIKALRAADVIVADSPWDLADLIQDHV